MVYQRWQCYIVGSLMGVKDLGKVYTKPASGKIVNCSYSCKIVYFTIVSRQLIHGCRYCSMNNTNELRLLVSSACLLGKKESTGGQISSKKKSIRARTSVLVSSSQPLPHTDDCLSSFYIAIALFKSRKYGNYVHVYTHFISR